MLALVLLLALPWALMTRNERKEAAAALWRCAWAMTNAVLRESGLKMGPRYRIMARMMPRWREPDLPDLVDEHIGMPDLEDCVIRLEVGDRALVGVNPDAGPLVACTCVRLLLEHSFSHCGVWPRVPAYPCPPAAHVAQHITRAHSSGGFHRGSLVYAHMIVLLDRYRDF